RGVHRGDVSVERSEGHARLRLLEKGPEPRLDFGFRRRGAQAFGDVADQREQLVSPRGDAMDGDLDIDSTAGLLDDRGRIAGRSLAAGEAARELRGQASAVLRGGEVDERRHRL